MKTLIRYEDLVVRLGKKTVFSIDELTINRHQCVLLTGRNGAGKTTLLKVIAGLLKPNAGRVEYQGLTMSWSKAKPFIQKDFIYLHQQPYLFDGSVFDNVAYGLYRHGEPKNTVHNKVMQALDWANLTHLAHRHARELSGGEKQRVALTRAHVLTPRFLIMDEPTSSMDKEAKHETACLIEKFKQEGTSILISSHEKEVIEHVCDQHLIIDNGKLTNASGRTNKNNVTLFNPLHKK